MNHHPGHAICNDSRETIGGDKFFPEHVIERLATEVERATRRSALLTLALPLSSLTVRLKAARLSVHFVIKRNERWKHVTVLTANCTLGLHLGNQLVFLYCVRFVDWPRKMEINIQNCDDKTPEFSGGRV